MKVEKDAAVIFDFTIKNDKGELLESSADGPAGYIQGMGTALPGIESALEGREPGYKTTIVLPPEQAFGQRDEDLTITVPLSEFEGEDLAVGMEFVADEDDDDNEDDDVCWRVTAIKDSEVTLDANHPYASLTLVFDIEITEVRKATDEELEHGHVHISKS